MTGRERDNHLVATFTVPAVLAGNEWIYGMIRFIVTDTADNFLVQHIVHTVRG